MMFFVGFFFSFTLQLLGRKWYADVSKCPLWGEKTFKIFILHFYYYQIKLGQRKTKFRVMLVPGSQSAAALGQPRASPL